MLRQAKSKLNLSSSSSQPRVAKCIRVGNHKVRCGVEGSGNSFPISISTGNLKGTYEVKMRHESNAFGQTSYPTSIRRCSSNTNPETANC